jgi:Pentapeptide repeats (8 copies)
MGVHLRRWWPVYALIAVAVQQTAGWGRLIGFILSRVVDALPIAWPYLLIAALATAQLVWERRHRRPDVPWVEAPRGRVRRWAAAAWLPVVAGLLLAAGIASIGPLPRLLHPPVPEAQLRGLSPRDRLDVQDVRRQRQNEARGTLLQAVAASVLLLGAWQAYRQLQVTREGQVTERFTRAVEQLGNRGSLDVRLGGIYALGRLARDSAVDEPTIVEILAAFIRERAPWPPRHPEQPPVDATIDESFPDFQARAPDVDAALRVLTEQLDLSGDNAPDLSKTDLRGVNLAGANLEDALLGDVSLQGATLAGATLDGALLVDTDLRGADLFQASLQGAKLVDVNLQGVELDEVDLRDALLHGVNLQDAKLTGADLRGAEASKATVWPKGFGDADQRAAGVVIDTALDDDEEPGE